MVTTIAPPARTVDHDGVVFVIRFPYDPLLVERVKQLPGRRWEPVGKTWTAPRSDALDALITDAGFVTTDAASTVLAAGSDAPAGTVMQSGPYLVIRTTYDVTLVAAIKAIPGRRWDTTERVWLAPLSSMRAVRDMAGRFGLSWRIGDDVDENTSTRPAVRVTGDRFEITAEFDRDLTDLLREIPGAEWDRSHWLWSVPLSAALDVWEFVAGRDVDVDLSAAAVLGEAREAFERIAASAATDAPLDVPGLGGDLMPFQRAGVVYALRALGFTPAPSGHWVRDVTP